MAAQAAIPTTKIQTRAVPRSRIVERSALYSSWSFAVIELVTRVIETALRLTAEIADNYENSGWNAVAHCGTRVGLGPGVGPAVSRPHGSVRIIPLASMDYLLHYRLPGYFNIRSGQFT